VHETTRTTPGVALGVTDHVWSIAELIEAANDPSEAPPLTPAEMAREKLGKVKLHVIQGGKTAKSRR
jgi:hypothetical protein